MADEFVNGTVNLLYIDEATAITVLPVAVLVPGVFKLVACLTDNGFEGSTDQIDTSSKCSGIFKNSLPGQMGWTFSGSGNAIDLAELDTRVSHLKLFKLWKAQTKFWVAQFDTAENAVQFGVAYISSFSLTNPNNAAAGFSITLQGVGEVFDQDDLA